MENIKIGYLILLIGMLGFTYFSGGNCLLCGLFKNEIKASGKENIVETNNNGPVTLNESNLIMRFLNQAFGCCGFYAIWCGPCKKLSPVIDELSAEYSGKIKIGKLNVDENGNLTSEYGINSIPHLVILTMESGNHIIGLHSKTELDSNLKQVLINKCIKKGKIISDGSNQHFIGIRHYLPGMWLSENRDNAP
jgi:thioredoxin 1